MEKYHIEDLIPEYLDKVLDENQNIKVEKHLKRCSSCKKALEEMKIIFSAFDKEIMVTSPDSMITDFYDMLEREIEKNSKVFINHPRTYSKRWLTQGLKIAASIALLVGSYFLGNYNLNVGKKQNQPIAKDRAVTTAEEKMLSLMENKSASKRIQGVNFIEKISNPDFEIINALVNRMLYDKNTNVRLTALEALDKYIILDQVKRAFIEALTTEKNENIQITLIRSLVRIQEKKAINPMERLLKLHDTHPMVKDQIELLLPIII